MLILIMIGQCLWRNKFWRGGGVVVVGMRLTQSFSLPSSAGVRGPASTGRVPSVEALAGEGRRCPKYISIF